MIYVDANVFLYALLNEATTSRVRSTITFLQKIVTGDIQAMTSFLTWDEIVWTLRKNINKEIAYAEGRKFLKFPNLRFLPPDEKVMNCAQDLVERYNLKPRDAIHAASAIIHGAKEIMTDDPDFDVVKELKRKSV